MRSVSLKEICNIVFTKSDKLRRWMHDHRNLPIVIASGAGSRIAGGRHVKYDELTPLANLHLTLLDEVGVHLDDFADSTGRVGEVSEPLTV